MIVRDILASKGTAVATIDPDASITELIDMLASQGIGAAVVSRDGTSIDGIVSERDVVRHLQSEGAAVLESHVADVMTADVQTCGPADEVSAVARTMTSGRFRHLPVLDGGALAGIVSIGDVVKKRIDELEDEAGHLRDYLASA